MIPIPTVLITSIDTHHVNRSTEAPCRHVLQYSHTLNVWVGNSAYNSESYKQSKCFLDQGQKGLSVSMWVSTCRITHLPHLVPVLYYYYHFFFLHPLLSSSSFMSPVYNDFLWNIRSLKSNSTPIYYFSTLPPRATNIIYLIQLFSSAGVPL